MENMDYTKINAQTIDSWIEDGLPNLLGLI